jgi:hypothetical protein
MAATGSVGGGRVGFGMVLEVRLISGGGVCYLQETHGVDILQDYTSQGIAVHILIWDPGIGVLGSPEFDGVKI